jgi:hypothetical protein
MRAVAHRLQLLFVALVVLLAATASDRAHYFCKMMDRAMAECCCAGAPASAEDAAKLAVQAPHCCERLVPSNHPVVAASDEAAPSSLTASSVALPPWLEYPTQVSRVLAARPAAARAPPALGPPLFLAHCSLLI